MEELRQEGVNACRVAGYGNVSSKILVFSTDVDYAPVSGDIRGIPVRRGSFTDADGMQINMRMKGKMVIARTRNYEIPGILLSLLYWTGGTNYVEIPVDVFYHESNESFRRKFRTAWNSKESRFWNED